MNNAEIGYLITNLENDILRTQEDVHTCNNVKESHEPTKKILLYNFVFHFTIY